MEIIWSILGTEGTRQTTKTPHCSGLATRASKTRVEPSTAPLPSPTQKIDDTNIDNCIRLNTIELISTNLKTEDMATHAPVTSMEPLSARIPSDLYLWLAQLQVEGATTNSDKLRVLLGQLKRQHDGLLDYVAAHAWVRDLMGRLREALVRAEGGTGKHSEVVSLLLEHVTAMMALAVSQAPATVSEACTFEEAFVRRAFALCETLLRQGTTPDAAAYDPTVVRRHMKPTIELAMNLQTPKGP
ncbi:MAG TPA: hypothetical protein PK981_04000 [Accumulibacter sp.]|nr:hypothetical protein [Accumulibacter sp.]HNN45907.1 hypothetical protein [Azospira sp.]HMW17746.1 hypothetical protein [Accumulibacter sp.]HMX21622.1 hypothetical protein [Accumulibacter sp.]HNG38196.1 hypothetical protein [Accumulibacter sp.]